MGGKVCKVLGEKETTVIIILPDCVFKVGVIQFFIYSKVFPKVKTPSVTKSKPSIYAMGEHHPSWSPYQPQAQSQFPLCYQGSGSSAYNLYVRA